MSPLREPAEHDLQRAARDLLVGVSVLLSAVVIYLCGVLLIYLSRSAVEGTPFRAGGNAALTVPFALGAAVLVAGALGWVVGAAIDRKSSRRAKVVMFRSKQAVLIVLAVLGVPWLINWMSVYPNAFWGLMILAALLACAALAELKPVDALLRGGRKPG